MSNRIEREPSYRPTLEPDGINADMAQRSALLKFIRLVIYFIIAMAVIGVAAVYGGGYFGRFIPFKYEARLHRPAMHPVFPGELRDDSSRRADLQTLANHLSRTLQFEDGMTITIHYVESEVINAYAAPGGHIYVTSAILNTLPTQEAVEALLAHEMGHVRERHAMRALSGNLALQLVFFAITGQDTRGLAQRIVSLQSLGYSRELEEEADEVAFSALIGRYGSSQGFRDLMTALPGAGESVPEITQWFATHPDRENRISRSLAADKKSS